jgi:hypothetical protein
LHGACLGWPVESARPAALAFFGGFHGSSFADFAKQAMKKFFIRADGQFLGKPKN